eukprot:GFYU01007722.1.p1 GENE.GFYU01007722.1~~GFYU01007722.1.p1  ORF type:complete len:495 (+),score=144.96 GFYU01007722.1:79-1563(+)
MSDSNGGFSHPVDPEEFRRLGHQMVDFIADYYKTVNEKPVLSEVSPGYLKELIPDSAPEKPESFEAIMKDVNDKIVPGVTHWQHPSYFAYYPANSSFPSMLGDMLSSCFNVIGFSWITSPACTELETIVMDWLGKLVGLPETFLSHTKGGGSIQGTASEAAIVGLLCARARKMAELKAALGHEPDFAGTVSKLVVYTSDQAHSSIKKALMVAGISQSNFRPIQTTAETGFSVDPTVLEQLIESDKAQGLIPMLMVATVGTTSSAAVDPVSVIGDICKKHELWLHVDAAYAGPSMMCEEHKHNFAGIEKADSFNFNCHKWMLTNFDCSVLWVQDRTPILDALSILPEYLKNKATESGKVIDYRDWQIPLGRRFRSLKLWFVLRMYGAEGLRSYIRHHVKMAETFTKYVNTDERFELTAPPRFSLVNFRLKADQEVNEKLMEEINATGKVFLTHTVLGDVYSIRMAIGGALTQQSHVDDCWKLISETATKLLMKQT